MTEMSKKKKKSLRSTVKPSISNLEAAKSLEISVTVQNVVDHLDFLNNIDARGRDKFYNPKFVHNSVRRYETLWLPLITSVSSSPKDDLKYVPPLGKTRPKYPDLV